MCGIVAMISKSSSGFSYKDSQMFDQMLYANALRGVDSTGVFGINKYGNLKMIKAAQCAAEFQKTKTYSNFSDSIFKDFRVVVGHNRATTKGATTDKNAHPFIEDHICLIHNGTLTSHKHLADTEVDSHAICTSISKVGYKETIPNIFGAFALVWYDAKDTKLYIVRNKERPLWIMDTPTTQFIASEPSMMQWLFSRVYGTTIPEAKYFDTSHVYSWDIKNLSSGYDTEDVPVKKSPPVVHNHHHHYVFPKPQEATHFGNNSSTQFGTKSSESTLGYKYGKEYCFTHDTNTVTKEYVIIKGTTYDDKEREVIANIRVEGMAEEEIDAILASEFLVGTFTGVSVKAGITKLLFNNIAPEPVYVTVNNETLTATQIDHFGSKCSSCNAEIDPSVDDYCFFARVKHCKIKSMLCPSCVENHPILGKRVSQWATINE